MQSILAIVLYSHNKHGAWWFKIIIKPKPNADMLSPLHEALGKYCLLKLLGNTKNDCYHSHGSGAEILVNTDVMDLSRVSLLCYE
jgi:hypothetical protein